MPFTHLCPTPDCECGNDLLAGISPATGPMVNRTPEWFQDALQELEDMGFKRRDPGAPKPMANAWNDPGDKADYPTIFGFLTETKYDDGKPRQTGSISIFTQLGVLKASISDKDNGQVAYVEALTLHELIELVERAICDDSTEWKASRKTPPY